MCFFFLGIYHTCLCMRTHKYNIFYLFVLITVCFNHKNSSFTETRDSLHLCFRWLRPHWLERCTTHNTHSRIDCWIKQRSVSMSASSTKQWAPFWWKWKDLVFFTSHPFHLTQSLGTESNNFGPSFCQQNLYRDPSTLFVLKTVFLPWHLYSWKCLWVMLHWIFETLCIRDCYSHFSARDIRTREKWGPYLSQWQGQD